MNSTRGAGRHSGALPNKAQDGETIYMSAGHVCTGSRDPHADVTGNGKALLRGIAVFSFTYADCLVKRGDSPPQAVVFSARWLSQ